MFEVCTRLSSTLATVVISKLFPKNTHISLDVTVFCLIFFTVFSCHLRKFNLKHINPRSLKEGGGQMDPPRFFWPQI